MLFLDRRLLDILTVEGVVLDPSGAPIPNMMVTDRSEDGVTVLRSTKTDSNGHFRFSAQRGKTVYCLRFDHPLFNPLQVKLKLDKNAPQPAQIYISFLLFNPADLAAVLVHDLPPDIRRIVEAHFFDGESIFKLQRRYKLKRRDQ